MLGFLIISTLSALLLSNGVVPTQGSLIFTSNTTLSLNTIHVAGSENYNGTLCILSHPTNNTCIVSNYNCSRIADVVVVVTQPNCQYTSLVRALYESTYCSSRNSSNCARGDTVVKGVLIQIVTGTVPGYNARTRWDANRDVVMPPTHEVVIGDMRPVFPLVRFSPQISLQPGENQWLAVYDSGLFITGRVISSILSGGCFCYIVVTLALHLIKSDKKSVLRIVYYSVDAAGCFIRLLVSISPLSSLYAYDWSAQQFLIAFVVGFTFVSIIIIPITVYPKIMKGINVGAKVERAIKAVYISIVSVIGAFTIIRPVSIVEYVDAEVRSWSGYISFAGILFGSIIYIIATSLVVHRVKITNKSTKQTQARTRKALIRIARVLGITSLLLLMYATLSIYAIADRAFLQPVPLAVVTILQLIILGLISLAHTFVFTMSESGTSTKSSSDISLKTTSVRSFNNPPPSPRS